MDKVPPTQFKEQFIKDLAREDVENLSQIKWIFDGKKTPENFKKNMLDAIDKLPLKDGTSLTDDLVKKFGVKNSDELINLIESKFENIFKLVQK